MGKEHFGEKEQQIQKHKGGRSHLLGEPKPMSAVWTGAWKSGHR